jgi:large subunit ribosomal protein L3
MTKFILGKKLEMTQIFKDDKVIPVTLVEAGPCFVTQIKTEEKDKYTALQIGFEKLPERKVKKSQKTKPYRYLREFREDKEAIKNYKIGQKIDVSIFQEGEKVKVSGVSKGKGFQGGVKRWGFSGRNATHGVKHEHRTLGSVGASGPERVFKGKKMPGHMGVERVTVKNLEVVKVDPENNLIALKGAVPGRRGTLVEIKKED